MQKFTFLFLACIIHFGYAVAQDQVVAGWTFSGNSLAADTGININLSQEISTTGGTSAIELKNGFSTKAAQASAWNNGMDTKGWVVSFSTSGFMNLTVSSRQQSGGTDPGPGQFRLQVSTDGGGSWTDVDGGEITVENEWETSFVDQLPLPASCEDMDEVMVRWLMDSNEASGAGGEVQEIGKSKIDEIYVRGELINASEDHLIQAFSIIPGSSRGSFRIESTRDMEKVCITTFMGAVLFEKQVGSSTVRVDLPAHVSRQLIMITILFRDAAATASCKYFLP